MTCIILQSCMWSVHYACAVRLAYQCSSLCCGKHVCYLQATFVWERDYSLENALDIYLWNIGQIDHDLEFDPEDDPENNLGIDLENVLRIILQNAYI